MPTRSLFATRFYEAPLADADLIAWVEQLLDQLFPLPEPAAEA